MRTLISCVLAACVLAACATKPAEPPVTKRVPVDASNIVQAQQAGYKIVNKNGEQLYCRKTFLTGSRLKSTTSCLTAAQWADLNQRSRDLVNERSRPVQTNIPHP
jgi:hypothetical protein